jgi:hypothetical protein
MPLERRQLAVFVVEKDPGAIIETERLRFKHLQNSGRPILRRLHAEGWEARKADCE